MPAFCVPTPRCTKRWAWRVSPAMTPCATCSSVLGKGSASDFFLACGLGSWNGFRNVLRDPPFLLHGWLRSGNCGTARGAVEFLKEALALLPQRHVLRVLRADSGF